METKSSWSAAAGIDWIDAGARRRAFYTNLGPGRYEFRVEASIDGGPWQKATLDPANTKYSWKLFSYKWDNATPGEHTIVSRATDVDGQVQPTAADLARKRTFLEDNGQFPRKVKIG